jgi:hypothetical protein
VHFVAGRHDGLLHAPLLQTITKSFCRASSQVRQAAGLSPFQPSTSIAPSQKKYDETNDIWQARVDDGYRFYFQIDGETYILLSIISHQK